MRKGGLHLVSPASTIVAKYTIDQVNTDRRFWVQASETPLISACHSRTAITPSLRTSYHHPTGLIDFSGPSNPFIVTLKQPLQEQGPEENQQAEPIPDDFPLTVAVGYVASDESYKETLLKHLKTINEFICPIKYNAYNMDNIGGWSTDTINPINESHLALLMLSVNFLSSGFCTTSFMNDALKNHKVHHHWTSLIILEDCLWENVIKRSAPTINVHFLPNDKKPVVKWDHPSSAYKNIADGIIDALKYLKLRT